jgi:CBS domain-containing protein
MFTSAVEQIGTLTIRELMSPVPISIDAESTLMEAAWIMVDHNQRRLIVTEDDKPTGIIREQDLFFQMGKHLIPPRLRRNVND